MAAPTRTYYEILGIARDADAMEVRRAWRVLVQVWHPDRFTGDMREEAERTTSGINAAYHALRDGSRRAAYDCSIAADAEQARPVRPATRAAAASTVRRTGAARQAPVAGHTTPAPPATMMDVAARASQDIIDTVRRSPRSMGIAAAVLVTMLVGSLLLGAITGPSMPAGTQAAHAEGLPQVARSQDMPSLDAIVEEADKDAHDAALAIDAPLPGADLAEEQLPQSEVLAEAQEDARADAELVPPPPRVIPTRKGGKRVLRVLPTG